MTEHFQPNNDNPVINDFKLLSLQVDNSSLGISPYSSNNNNLKLNLETVDVIVCKAIAFRELYAFNNGSSNTFAHEVS